MITVDSRKRDSKSVMMVKYVNEAGRPVQYKPIRKIYPDRLRLSPLARFIADRADGKYIGGMLIRGFVVRVEGCEGSAFELEVKTHGTDRAESIKKIMGTCYKTRATIQGWLFPVFEPEMDETDFFNQEAKKISFAAGTGGRVIINDEIMEVSRD